MAAKIFIIGFGISILLLSVLILPNSLAAPGEEAVHAYNQHNLYYENDFPSYPGKSN